MRSRAIGLAALVGLCSCRAAVPPPTTAATSDTVTNVEIDGALEVLIEDGRAGSVLHVFVVDPCGKRRRLRFSGQPPPWKTGTRVHVAGVEAPDGALAQTTVHDLGDAPAGALTRPRCAGEKP